MLGGISLSKIKTLILTLIIISSIITFANNDIIKLPEGVSIYQLDNGIQVMLIEKPSLPMVGINTVVKVGSAYENFATSGMSHMLEHLLFNGTTSLTQKELYDATDKIGGYNNANTSEYYTNFMMVTPSENILEGMKLQSAMLFNSVMPEDKFEKEKGIVLEEIAKSFGNANDQIERNILPIIYKGHALSLSTLGTYETIKNMNRDDVYDFYKNFYVPNNMIISVIGSFNSKEMLENIKEIYGKAKPGVIKEANTSGLNIAFEDVPSLDNEQNVYHRFYSGSNTQLQLFFELPTPKNLEFYDVLNLVLENQSEPIKNKLNSYFENVIDGIEFNTREYKVKSFLQVTATLNSDNNINSIKDSLFSILGSIDFQLSPESIKSEEIKSRTSFLQNTEKPHMFGIYNANLFAQYGMEAILASYSGKGYGAAAEEVTQISITNDPLIIVQHPNLLSSENDIIENQLPKLFENKNGGATVIAKESKGSDLLAIHYLIKNKAAYEEKYGKDAAKILHDIFGDRMIQPEVQKQNSQYGFSFTVNDNPFIPMDNIYLSPEFGYIRVEGLGDNIKEAISFLNEKMISFIPTEDEFMTATGKSKMPSMMGHGNMAKLLFDNKVNEIVYEEEKYKENKTPLTYENLIGFAKFYFQPSNMIISVVSKETHESINSYFANFTKPIPEGTIANPAFIKKFKEISQPINVNLEGGGEQSYLYYGYQKNIDKNDEAALQVLSLLLSDKIVFDIREKQGMAYRMSAGIDVVNNKAMFNINMGTRPENIDKLIPQLPNFFTKEYLGTISEDEVTKSVNMYLGRMMFRRLSSINQAYYLGYSKYFNNDIFYDSKSLNELKKITKDDINKVAAKYLSVQNPVQIIVR